jgi:hypothetical protein
LFTSKNEGVKLNNQFIWFRRWVIGKQTLDQLSLDSSYSKRKVQYLFKAYLSKPPQFIIKNKLALNLMIDGTYMNGDACLILYYDSKLKYALFYRWTNQEYFTEIKEDLENLKLLGIDLQSVTCDGKKAIINAVRKVYPQALVQRCIVHIQRMVRHWLTRKPKSTTAKELRYLIGLVHHITNVTEQMMWTIAFEKWYETHKVFINEKVKNKPTNRWWYKHRQVRRCAVLIKVALPDMFHFIKNSNIPKSTNGIDSYFGHLKLNLNVHRGLTYEHRNNFVLWYLYFKANPV